MTKKTVEARARKAFPGLNLYAVARENRAAETGTTAALWERHSDGPRMLFTGHGANAAEAYADLAAKL